MNSQPVVVEQRYRRPIISAFHGLFSAGGIAGSPVGAATLAAGVRPAGANMSRVVGLGYPGFLAGPACIGWIAEVTSLTTAMVVPLACVLLAALLAPVLTPTAPTR